MSHQSPFYSKHFLFFFAGMLFILSCKQEPDLQHCRAEILDLHRQAIQAHLEKDAGFFTRDLAEGYFSVGNGVIRYPSNKEINRQFSSYLNNTEFTDYRDLEDPVIGFSDDGSLAWSIVRVHVAGKRKMVDDSVRQFDTTWAWITLYKRERDRWLRMGEVSSHD